MEEDRKVGLEGNLLLVLNGRHVYRSVVGGRARLQECRWESTCLACPRPWIQSPALQKQRRKMFVKDFQLVLSGEGQKKIPPKSATHPLLSSHVLQVLDKAIQQEKATKGIESGKGKK